MTRKDKTCNKRDNRRAIGNSLASLFSVLLFILLSSFVFAIPNTLTLQGKLTNIAGSSLSGTYTMVFRIYDIPNYSYYNVSNQTSEDNTAITNYTYINYTNILWEKNRTVTTDANGIYDVVLYNLSALNFSEQYYLGITVGSDNESTPRINLTSSPYAFRANISEDLNKENRYEVSVLNVTGNLTIGERFDDVLTVTTGRLNISDGSIRAAGNLTLAEKITFSLGAIIDNLVNGFLRINSGLNVTGNVSIAQDTLFVDNTSGRVGIGTTAPVDTLTVIGSVSTFGSLNATYINATRVTGTEILIGTKPVQASGDFSLGNISNYTQYIRSSDFNLGNISNYTQYVRSSDFNLGNISNYSQFVKGADFNLGNISNNTLTKDNNASISLWNASGVNIFLREITGNVGIGTITPLQKLEVAGNILVNNTNNAFVNLSGPIIRKSGNDIVISD